jgi:plasmid stability protein
MAAADDRTISYEVRRILTEHLQERSAPETREPAASM